jgi:hypothetical protein
MIDHHSDSDSDSDSIEPLAELIDRIVDGGLTPAQLRRVVSELDSTPGGWRRCALSFIEAQAWGEAFRNLDGTVEEKPRLLPDSDCSVPAMASTLRPVSTSSVISRRWIGDALAAGIAIIAFSLGWLVHGVRNPVQSDRPANPAVVTAKADPVPEPPVAVASEPPASSAPRESDLISALPRDRIPTVQEVARLRIGTGDPNSPEIPILAGSGVNPQWLLQQPPPISDHERAIWQRQGYQLDQSRRVVSVPLGDGRRAAVPVDQVQVRYVGHVPL